MGVDLLGGHVCFEGNAGIEGRKYPSYVTVVCLLSLVSFRLTAINVFLYLMYIAVFDVARRFSSQTLKRAKASASGAPLGAKCTEVSRHA
jgi:hypothetical protein